MKESAIRLHIEPLDGGGFLATSPDVPGLVAEGRSVTEAAEIAQGLARKIAESCIEHGDPLPRALATLPKIQGQARGPVPTDDGDRAWKDRAAGNWDLPSSPVTRSASL